MAMARVVELRFAEEKLAYLERVSRSRKESVSHVRAALDDRPRPGRERTITGEGRTFVVYLACEPKDLDYPHQVWTKRLLAVHVANVARRSDTRASPISPREPCVRYWPPTRSSRTR
jgi:hypothetical protein